MLSTRRSRISAYLLAHIFSITTTTTTTAFTTSKITTTRWCGSSISPHSHNHIQISSPPFLQHPRRRSRGISSSSQLHVAQPLASSSPPSNDTDAISPLQSSSSPSAPTTSDPPPSSITTTEALNSQLAAFLHKLEHTGQIINAYSSETSLTQFPTLTDTVTYNTAISAWARAAQKFASGLANVPMDGRSGVYNARDAAMRAQNLLEDWISQYEDGASVPPPDVISYNAAIDAWGKSRVKDAGPKAEELLRTMLSRVARSEDAPQPDSVTFNSVIEAWAQSSIASAPGTAIAHAEALLKLMGDIGVEPTVRTYNGIIHVYAKSKRGTERGGGRQSSPRRNNNMNNNNYDKSSDYVPRIMEIMNLLEQKYALTNSEEHKPDVTTFTSIIDCIAHSQHPSKGDIALQILQRMETLHNATNDTAVKPNVRTYTAVINAIAHGSDPNSAARAESFLETMESTYRRTGDDNIKPNAWTYTAVVNAWSRSRDAKKPQRTLRLLKAMNDRYKETKDESVKPNLFVYNGVIDACARCHALDDPEQQRHALKIAFAVFKALEKDASVKANEVTYGTLFKVVNNLLPTSTGGDDAVGGERESVVRAIWSKCSDSGMVNEGVLRQLRQAAGGALYEDLVGAGGDGDYSAKVRELRNKGL